MARAVFLAFALLAAAVIPAHASPSLPRLLRFDDTSNFAVRPPTLAFGADGGVLVLGPNVSKSDFRAHHDGHIHWKYWNRTDGASGVGTLWINQCRPDCAAGHYSSQPVVVVAANAVNGHYTRVVLSYGAGRSGTYQSYRLKRFGRLWGWQ
jgi:hypothetical protein